MITIELGTDGTGHIHLPTGSRQITATSLSQARSQVITILTNHAQTSGRILTAAVTTATEPTVTLAVHPNGTINELNHPAQEEPTMHHDHAHPHPASNSSQDSSTPPPKPQYTGPVSHAQSEHTRREAPHSSTGEDLTGLASSPAPCPLGVQALR